MVELETDRLLIRDVRASDADDFYQYMRLETYWRDVPIEPPTVELVEALVNRCIQERRTLLGASRAHESPPRRSLRLSSPFAPMPGSFERCGQPQASMLSALAGERLEPARQRLARLGGDGVLGLGDGLPRPLPRFPRRDAIDFVKQSAEGAHIPKPERIGDMSNPAIGEFRCGDLLERPAQSRLANIFGDAARRFEKPIEGGARQAESGGDGVRAQIG